MKMMLRLALCLCAFAVGECAQARLPTSNYEHLRSSIVRITSIARSFDWLNAFNEGASSMSVGSGFVVQVGPYPLFATNAHVVSDATRVNLQLLLLGARQWEAQVVSVCSKFDLALLVLKDPDSFLAATEAAKVTLTKIPLSDKVAMMGADVVALGFPLGQDSLKFSKGNIAGNEDVNGNMCIQSTAPISPGSSGGPLLNEAGNVIVGVNFAKATTGENINYVIPAFRVGQLVKKHLKDQPVNTSNASWQRISVRVPGAELTTEHSNKALYKLSGGCEKGLYVSHVGHRSFFRKAEPPVAERFLLESVNGVELDAFGNGLKPEYAADRVDFDDLFFMVSDLSADISFKTCNEGMVQDHKVSTAWKPEYGRGIVYVDEPVLSGMSSSFELFGGVSVMELTTNHIQQLVSQGNTQCARWLHPNLIDKPRLVVSSVQQGTYASTVLWPGSVIKKVNDNHVTTLEEFRESFMPHDDVWTLETDTGSFLALMFEESLVQHVNLVRGKPHLLSRAVANAANASGLVVTAEGGAVQPLDYKLVKANHSEHAVKFVNSGKHSHETHHHKHSEKADKADEAKVMGAGLDEAESDMGISHKESKKAHHHKHSEKADKADEAKAVGSVLDEAESEMGISHKVSKEASEDADTEGATTTANETSKDAANETSEASGNGTTKMTVPEPVQDPRDSEHDQLDKFMNMDEGESVSLKVNANAAQSEDNPKASTPEATPATATEGSAQASTPEATPAMATEGSDQDKPAAAEEVPVAAAEESQPAAAQSEEAKEAETQDAQVAAAEGSPSAATQSEAEKDEEVRMAQSRRQAEKDLGVSEAVTSTSQDVADQDSDKAVTPDANAAAEPEDEEEKALEEEVRKRKQQMSEVQITAKRQLRVQRGAPPQVRAAGPLLVNKAASGLLQTGSALFAPLKV